MRYTGPVWKKSRRLGYSVLESGKELRKRSYAPGQHGNEKKKLSEYGKQLAEKQKLRETYGVNERQFRRLYVIATKSNEVTGLAFMRLLESRLDNLVYRLGFASTRRQARQLVNHGHVLVNGKKIDIPSYLVNVNDVISLKGKSQSLEIVKKNLEGITTTAQYVELDKEHFKGTFTRLPERNELSSDINESLIVEYYNRLL